jgi:hypothetical protein
VWISAGLEQDDVSVTHPVEDVTELSEEIIDLTVMHVALAGREVLNPRTGVEALDDLGITHRVGHPL